MAGIVYVCDVMCVLCVCGIWGVCVLGKRVRERKQGAQLASI